MPGIHLGNLIDAEPDGQPAPTATGDNATGVNDEDGVRFTSPLHLGQTARLEVIASTNGQLSAWIDFNHEGGWAQANEQVLASVALQPGTNLLTLSIPADAALGHTVARFRFSTTADLTPTGLALDGEVEDYSVNVAPAADLVLTQTLLDSQLFDSQLSTLTLHATNTGPSAATSVLLTHLLSRRSTYVSAISSQGNCTHLNGVVTCALGTLPTGAGISVTLTTTIGQGTNTSATTIRADEFDPSPADANATSTIIGTRRTPQFANSDIILMPLPDAGAADPYPAGIIVSGVTGAVHQLTVTLRGLSHDYPDDIDILLVGPHGQAVILMSDAGFDHPIVDATITFDDLLGQPLPDSIPAISTGSYRPFNHAPADDSFPAPAPAGPYSADLSAFRGTDPNGLWSLYVIDDSLDNGGSDVPGFIADGWSLNMLTAEPLADLGVTVTASSGLVSIGEAITYSISITNHGPTASSALCHYSLPPSLNFISTPQGACSLLAGVITCDLGEIAPGSSVTFSITTAASIGGGVSNVFTVTGSALDLFTSNNSAPASLFVRPLVNLALAASAPASPFLLLQPSLYFVSLTNHGPNVATGVWLTNLLPSGATYLSSSTSQGSCSAIGQTVVCSLGVVPVGASPSLVVRFAPGSLGLNRAFSQVASEEEDSSPGDNSRVSLFTVEPACDLAISSAATGATVPLNGDYVVTLSVTNLGPLAVDAALTDTLPATTSFVSAFTTRGACTNAGNLVRCDFLNLAPGEGASVILRARATALGALTNVATVTGSLPDVDLANNGATHLAMVVPNSNLALGISDRPNPVWLGENLTYLIAVTNLGPSAAANVVLTNQLPAGIAFVSANATQGSCSRLGDVVRCELGAMAVNATLTVSITARPPQAGFITNSALVFASTDVEGSDNGAAKVTRVISGNVNLANSTALSIPFLGLANPYPSTITVSGLSSAIFRLRVSLLNLSHTFADDLDVLLVGPDGRACWLMSDAGGEFALSNVSLTFDDAATNALGDSSPNSSGTVRPANFGTEAESFAAPAPAGPYATNLSIFHGSDPNGTWSLYIMDDAEKDSGALAGGWRLTISAFEPLADLAVAQVAAPNPVGTGSNVVFTCTVSNLGPSIASGVRLTHSFPAGLVVTGFTNAHGACTSAGGRLVCDMGSLVPGGSGALSVWATALVPGTFTNVAGVAFDGVDLRLTNNAAAVAVTFVLPPVITLQPVSQTVALGGSVQFAAAASGAAPLAFQWHFNGVPVAGGGGQGSEFGIQNVQLAQAGSYRVRVSNAVGAAWSEPALLLIPGPPSLSFLPNLALDEDSNSGPISFTVQDFDTPAASLVLSAASSNLQLVPAAGLSFGGEGQNRTVRIAPAANASGSTTITVWVRDTTGAATTNVFTVVVRPVLDPIVVLMQPRHRLSVTGATVVLSVSAGSDLPVAFQWFFQGGQGAEVRVQGTEVSGQSSGGRGQGSEFRVQNIQSTNAGEYRVQLSSADTNVWSATARVVVTNSLPVPNIVSISQQGAQASVTFSTVVGLTYRLEFKRFLEDTAWSALGSIEGTGRSEILTDPAAGGAARFYRVRAE